jgi:hypothetical protein
MADWVENVQGLVERGLFQWQVPFLNPSFSNAIHEYAYLTSAADTVVLKYKNDVAPQVTFFISRFALLLFFFSPLSA